MSELVSKKLPEINIGKGVVATLAVYAALGGFANKSGAETDRHATVTPVEQSHEGLNSGIGIEDDGINPVTGHEENDYRGRGDCHVKQNDDGEYDEHNSDNNAKSGEEHKGPAYDVLDIERPSEVEGHKGESAGKQLEKLEDELETGKLEKSTKVINTWCDEDGNVHEDREVELERETEVKGVILEEVRTTEDGKIIVTVNNRERVIKEPVLIRNVVKGNRVVKMLVTDKEVCHNDLKTVTKEVVSETPPMVQEKVEVKETPVIESETTTQQLPPTVKVEVIEREVVREVEDEDEDEKEREKEHGREEKDKDHDKDHGKDRDDEECKEEDEDNDNDKEKEHDNKDHDHDKDHDGKDRDHDKEKSEKHEEDKENEGDKKDHKEPKHEDQDKDKKEDAKKSEDDKSEKESDESKDSYEKEDDDESDKKDESTFKPSGAVTHADPAPRELDSDSAKSHN